MAPIKVMVVDDHPVVVEGLKEMLRGEPDIEVCAEASSGEEALVQIGRASPDVVLMDVRMPGIGGVEATRRITQITPQTKVLLLTAYKEQYLTHSAECNVQGYLLKDIKQAELAYAIRKVHSGQTLQNVVQSLTTPSQLSEQSKRLSLSPRQQEIIRWVASGAANKEIALRLHLSDTTVKREMRSIFDKLGAVDRAEAVSLAYRHGLLQ